MTRIFTIIAIIVIITAVIIPLGERQCFQRPITLGGNGKIGGKAKEAEDSKHGKEEEEEEDNREKREEKAESLILSMSLLPLCLTKIALYHGLLLLLCRSFPIGMLLPERIVLRQ